MIFKEYSWDRASIDRSYSRTIYVLWLALGSRTCFVIGRLGMTSSESNTFGPDASDDVNGLIKRRGVCPLWAMSSLEEI